MNTQRSFQIVNKAASTAFHQLFVESCLEAQSLISWQVEHVKKGEQTGDGSCSLCVALIGHPQRTKVKE